MVWQKKWASTESILKEFAKNGMQTLSYHYHYTRYHINVLLKLSQVLYPIWEADEEVRTQVNNISQNLNRNLNILK